jgi:hypothetical protein
MNNMNLTINQSELKYSINRNSVADVWKAFYYNHKNNIQVIIYLLVLYKEMLIFLLVWLSEAIKDVLKYVTFKFVVWTIFLSGVGSNSSERKIQNWYAKNLTLSYMVTCICRLNIQSFIIIRRNSTEKTMLLKTIYIIILYNVCH